MKSFSKYRPFIVMFLFTLIAAGCGNDLKTLSQSGEGVSSCPSKTSTIQEASKVAWSSFYQNLNQSYSDQGFLIQKGDKIVVTVNRVCMMERSDFSDYILTKNISLKLKNHKHSKEESHTFVAPKQITSVELEAFAEIDECVVMVSPHVTMYVNSEPNDSKYASQTHLAAINYGTTYDWYFTASPSVNSDTVIAIIDNGVDITHPELKDILWVNTAEKSGRSGVDDDNNGYIDDIYGYDFATNVADPNHKYTGSSAGYSHGTHVAGLAAASTNNTIGVSGVMARNAKIMALNVFGNSQGASTSNIDTAIRYAADMGAKVLNLSLGGKGSTPSTESALKYAVSKGATVVLAAGNDSATLTSSNFYTPASYGYTIDGVITVGATDSNPSQIGALCSFSNRSTTYVEVGGPGCDTSKSSMGVLSLLRNNGYGLMAGTSMASPVVAGVTTVLLSYVRDAYQKNLTPAEVENLLKTGSKNFSSLNSYIKNGMNVDLLSIKEKLIATYGATSPIENPSPETPVECP